MIDCLVLAEFPAANEMDCLPNPVFQYRLIGNDSTDFLLPSKISSPGAANCPTWETSLERVR